jgi:hypothetical protein
LIPNIRLNKEALLGTIFLLYTKQLPKTLVPNIRLNKEALLGTIFLLYSKTVTKNIDSKY